MNKELLPDTGIVDHFVIFLTENEVREKCYLIKIQWRKLKIFEFISVDFLIVSSSLRNFSHHLRLDLLSKFSFTLIYYLKVTISCKKLSCGLDLKLFTKNSCEVTFNFSTTTLKARFISSLSLISYISGDNPSQNVKSK